jgi:hypothetical protein
MAIFRHALCLLLKSQRRTADSLLLEVEIYVDVVGDLDERNFLVHPEVLTVEDHLALNLAWTCPLTGNY